MSSIIQASLVLMGAGMSVVFLTLGIFFVLILVFEKVLKNKETSEGPKN